MPAHLGDVSGDPPLPQRPVAFDDGSCPLQAAAVLVGKIILGVVVALMLVMIGVYLAA